MTYDISDIDIISQEELIENFDDITEDMLETNDPIRITTNNNGTFVLLTEREAYEILKEYNPEDRY